MLLDRKTTATLYKICKSLFWENPLYCCILCFIRNIALWFNSFFLAGVVKTHGENKDNTETELSVPCIQDEWASRHPVHDGSFHKLRHFDAVTHTIGPTTLDWAWSCIALPAGFVRSYFGLNVYKFCKYKRTKNVTLYIFVKLWSFLAKKNVKIQ